MDQRWARHIGALLAADRGGEPVLKLLPPAPVAGCCHNSKYLGANRADCMLPNVARDTEVAVSIKIFGFPVAEGGFLALQKFLW